jgi:hypothetical protein
MTLTLAELAAAQCNLVDKVISYINCKKYSTECCREQALEALMLLESVSNDCDIPYETVCAIRNLPDLEVTCSGTPTCADLASLSTRKSYSGGVFSKSFENDFNQTAYPSIILTPDSIAQPAEGVVVITDSYGNVSSSYPVATGDYFDGSTVLSGDEYHPSADIRFLTGPIVGTATGYFKSIRLGRRDVDGTLSFTDVDISPSNIWVCGTCAAVSPADLYFNSPNLKTALKNQIINAIKAADHQAYIDLDITETWLPGGISGLTFSTKVKHQPSTIWWGLSPVNMQFNYYLDSHYPNVTLTKINNALASAVHANAGRMYNVTPFVTGCGSHNITVSSSTIVPQLSEVTTFYNIVLNTPVTKTGAGNLPIEPIGSINNCTSVTLGASVDSLVPYTFT